MNKTPIKERIERFIIFHDPQEHIPIHPDDAEKVGKTLWGKFHLPFKILAQAGTWGGPDAR